MDTEKNNPTENAGSKSKRFEYDLTNFDSYKLQALLLQESALSDDDNLNDGLVMHIVDVLEEREPVFDDLDVNASLEKFNAEVIPMIEKEVLAEAEAQSQDKSKAERPGSGYERQRVATVLLALIVTFVVGRTAIVNATGFDLWEYIVSWGKETFKIGPGIEITGESELDVSIDEGIASIRSEADNYDSIDAAMEALNIKALTPKWIPDGFQLSKVDIAQTPMCKDITALYLSDEKRLVFTVAMYSDNEAASAYELDENGGEVLLIDDLEHYFMSNKEQIQVIWTRDQCLYSISGNVSREEIVRMLDSIYEGES
ncbi:MAG: DUF4367 domain-containing protein [Clostridiaceae bacterium]|nr:DUF4367 domain-containing protein [Clostridiaceae bacterium]